MTLVSARYAKQRFNEATFNIRREDNKPTPEININIPASILDKKVGISLYRKSKKYSYRIKPETAIKKEPITATTKSLSTTSQSLSISPPTRESKVAAGTLNSILSGIKKSMVSVTPIKANEKFSGNIVFAATNSDFCIKTTNNNIRLNIYGSDLKDLTLKKSR